MAQYSTLQIRQSFKMIGFSENEIKVFLFLFQQKKATAKEASKNVAISFSSAQYALSNLCRKGVIKCDPKKNEEYEARSEKEILEWIEEQKKQHEGIYNKAKTDIHDLLSAIEGTSWHPAILYYEGIEGIIEIYEDMLNSAEEEIYSWLDIPKLEKILGGYLQEYINKRVKKKITSYDIMPENKVNLDYARRDEKRKVKFVEKENLPIDGEIRIYGDKVAVITFHNKKLVGFVFQGKTITALFRAIFKSAWES